MKIKTDKSFIKIINISNCDTTTILQDLYQRGIGKLLVEAGPNITAISPIQTSK